MERKIPNTLQEKLLDERSSLYKTKWAIEEAITALASNNVASYSLGNRSVTHHDVQKLRDLLAEADSRINEIEAMLRGASPRNVSVSTYLDPSILIRRM